jgi:heme-degrading monooxygenase HmoA
MLHPPSLISPVPRACWQGVAQNVPSAEGGSMHATMTMFTMPPGMREKMEQLADKMIIGMRQMPGFVSITFLRNEEINEYGGLALWESKENAEEAMSQTGQQLDEALSGKAIGPLRRSMFEVYESSV